MKLFVFIREMFYFLTASLVIGAILELVFPRMVLAYINLNFLLLVWFVFGIILLVFPLNKGNL
jgi:hypothetical protein